MNENLVLEFMKTKAASTAALGKTIKFLIDDSPIFIDGTGDQNVVSTDNKEADCVISASASTLEKLQSGDLNPMMAVMTGKIKIKGDMSVAMKIQSLLA